MDDLLQLSEKAIAVLKEANCGKTVQLSEKDRNVFYFLKALQGWASPLFIRKDLDATLCPLRKKRLECTPYDPTHEFWITFKLKQKKPLKDEYFQKLAHLVQTEMIPCLLESYILVVAPDKLYIYKWWGHGQKTYCHYFNNFDKTERIDSSKAPTSNVHISHYNAHSYCPPNYRQFQKDLLRFQHICMPIEWKSPIYILLNVFMIPDLSQMVIDFLHWYSSKSALSTYECRLIIEGPNG